MPELIKLLIRHALIGYGLSVLLVICMLSFNVGGFTDLVTHTDHGWVAALMLLGFTGITFASAQMGIAVMGAGQEDDDANSPFGMVRNAMSRIRVLCLSSSNGAKTKQ
jgi:hypothetical protein